MAKTNRLVGAHVSAAGGIEKAIERAANIGANCVQIFSASPRVWSKPHLDKYDVKSLHANQQQFRVDPIVIHALYLINLVSENPTQVKKSIDSLVFELKFDSLIKGQGVVVHLGSHQGRGWEAVNHQLLTSIKQILDHSPADSTFLIENSAGQNGKIGSNLAEIRWLIDQLKSPRVGWAFDTCHAFCAGYALDPRADNSAAQIITDLDLWPTLKVIHVNDSRDPFNSHKDRHANLGDGQIPSADLRAFLALKQIEDLPLILEVPGIDGTGPDAENIIRLKSLVG